MDSQSAILFGPLAEEVLLRSAFAAEVLPKVSSQETTKDMGADICEHDWQRDGQTLMSIRWTCTKCGKTMLN